MTLRISNKSWSTKAQKQYFHTFLPDYRSGRFKVYENTFSNVEILNCLESETNSSRSVAKLLKSSLGNKTIDSILIIGAGSGRLGTQIRKLYPNVILFEVDKNPIVIERLQNKHKNDPGHQALVGETHKLHFGDNTRDAIVCYSVFRYIENIQKSLDELIRVVKNGGTIFIGEAKKRSVIEKIKKKLKQKNIFFKTKTIPKIKLPHLTFFYYLVNRYSNEKIITEMIDEEMSNTNTTVVEAAFKLAGYSLGSIYTVILQKQP